MFLKDLNHVAAPGCDPPLYQFPMFTQNCILRAVVGAGLQLMFLKDVATPGHDSSGYQFPRLTQNCISHSVVVAGLS